MSISERIWQLLKEGKLVEVRPVRPQHEKIRSMYLVNALHSEIHLERNEESEKARFATLHADLVAFVTDPVIDQTYLFCLSPTGKGVWEIRSTRPKPSIRVFGMFSSKDTLIATHHVIRKPLGGWKTLEWKKEIQKTRQTWNQLFPAYKPLVSPNIDDVINGGLDGKYFKQ